ncbi:MAG: hypothetical protein Q9161_000787 [Pseudevernia consocians]
MIFCNPIVEASDSLKVDIITFEWAFVIDTDLGSDLSFTRPTFEIVAGPTHTSFVAHASVLEKAEKLKVVIRGKWKDSIDRRIVLEDWDGASVSRLLELLYTGDYESPCPAEDPQPEAKASEVRGPETSVPSSWDVEAPRSAPKSENATGSQRSLIPLADNSSSKTDPELAPSNAEDFKQWTEKFTRTHCVLTFEAALLAHAPLCYPGPSLSTSQGRVVIHQGTHLHLYFSPPNSQPANCKYAGDQQYSYTGSVRVRNYY